MTQTSGPVNDQPFTDAQWRAILGGEPGIVGDIDGTAYNLTLSPNSDEAIIGSATVDSTAVVAGFMHQIAKGQTHSITIPAPTSAARTDLIVLRYDPTFVANTPAGASAPIRLHRIAGTEGASGIPAYDAGPPGTEDLPLWSITRQAGNPAPPLAQASTSPRRIRLGYSLSTDRIRDLPTEAPFGTRVWARDTRKDYIRTRSDQGGGTWDTVSGGVSAPIHASLSTSAASYTIGASGGTRTITTVDLGDDTLGAPQRARLVTIEFGVVFTSLSGYADVSIVSDPGTTPSSLRSVRVNSADVSATGSLTVYIAAGEIPAYGLQVVTTGAATISSTPRFTYMTVNRWD